MVDSDLLADVVKRGPLLEAIREEPHTREMVEDRIGVSTTTSYRLTGRLADLGLIAEADGSFSLTPQGRRIATATSQFESAARQTVPTDERVRDRLVELVRLAPALDAFDDGPLDRRELEEDLGVSKTTSYRFARTLDEMGLIVKSDGRYERTDAGDALAGSLASFVTTVRTTRSLAPVLEAAADTRPPIPIEALADATVTTLEDGDAFGQVDRFITLVEGTDSLRGMDLNAIAPLYIEEITSLVLDGMHLEMISTPSVVEDTADKYPYACAKLCINGNVEPWVHDDLPFGLAIFDDRVGIGVQDPDERRLRLFVDTDAPAVREWAAAVFESYRDASVRLEQLSKKALYAAFPDRELGVSQ